MIDLRHITVIYSTTEDRLRLSGEGEPGQTVTLWLTQRLLNRLIPELIRWLEKHTGQQLGKTLDAIPRSETLMSFAQEKAQQQLPPHKPVEVKPQSQTWLVEEVNLRTSDMHTQFTFKSADNQTARLILNATALRQWLGLIHQAYGKAGWPQTIWPGWMAESTPAKQTKPAGVVLH
jgi:hypothetical protein